tara:strand:+ start:137 stop:670 length:534 start_codon:yes stop_codon:yes gene_type:complete
MSRIDDNVKSLITILEESNVDELEVSTFWGKQKIKVRKNTRPNSQNYEILSKEDSPIENLIESRNQDVIHKVQHPEAVKKNDNENKTDKPPIEEPLENTQTIKAPLVGTYYSSTKPGEPPFINEGDIIKEGQIICIIEAMKIFNEIEAEVSGQVKKILINDATPVEYDQDLIIISPN